MGQYHEQLNKVTTVPYVNGKCSKVLIPTDFHWKSSNVWSLYVEEAAVKANQSRGNREKYKGFGGAQLLYQFVN